jgi:alkanesulfonate monooxygenase SsuD/methylene tetrahydromethanopterin reductase-like flavin-dependent oxidoreductase (luciferase family)
VTTHVGLCATATTSYNEPYHIARKFASLDHISGGRAMVDVATAVRPRRRQGLLDERSQGLAEMTINVAGVT